MNGETTNHNMEQLLLHIDTFVFDVDGVFTDGTVTLGDDGQYSRTYHTRDGLAIRIALQAGFDVWIITGGKGQSIHARFHHLGVSEIHCINQQQKEVQLEALMKKHHRTPPQLCYMGDDLPDMKAMQLCGLRCCPADAADDILKTANYISPYLGGQGCVRDIVEQTLKAQHKWQQHSLTISNH